MKSDIDVTCILCPIGCEIRVNRKILSIIDGPKCKRGIEYAKNEIINPRRIITTTMYVRNGEIPLVSVKTSRPIPKDKIFEILNIIKSKSVEAPIEIGQIIIKNILNTNSDIIATKSIGKI